LRDANNNNNNNNNDNKSMKLQAGTTPEERESFARHFLANDDDDENNSSLSSGLDREQQQPAVRSSQLPRQEEDEGEGGGAGLHDTFRWIHGAETKGVFSYWSARSRNRFDWFLRIAKLALVTRADFLAMSNHSPVHFLVLLLNLPHRPLNRGLRIDYFLADRGLAESHLADAFVLDEISGSDHCPVGVHLQVPKNFLA
jgi:exonuclease III